MESYQQGGSRFSSDETLQANNVGSRSRPRGSFSSNTSDYPNRLPPDGRSNRGDSQCRSMQSGGASAASKSQLSTDGGHLSSSGHSGYAGSFTDKVTRDFSEQHPPGRKRTGLVSATIAASILALLLCAKSLLFPSRQKPSEGEISNSRAHDSSRDNSPNEEEWKKRSQDFFDDRGRFILEDFDAKPAFSDFLPGVAGIYGKPVWAFYVNRGQGIASFGIKSKDYPIMEFLPANKAYQNTAALGFRTFLQGSRGAHSFFAEPFAPIKTRFEGIADDMNLLPKRFMFVGANEMQICETDPVNLIETNVTYFTLPEEDFGAFVRRTTITNLDKSQSLKLSMLDGLAKIEPAGGKIDKFLKNIGRTLEGFFGVYQAHNDVITMPFFRMSTEASDTAAVKVQKEGHYLLSFIEGDNSWLLPIVYDTSKVFGEDTMMQRPIGLQTSSVDDILKGPQYGFAKTSSAFAAVDNIVIPPGKSMTVASFYGKTDDIMNVPVIARRIIAAGFVQYKFSRATEIIKQITAGVETKTSYELFDGHVQQMYLDNSLRGGFPIVLGETDDDARMSSADDDKRLKAYSIFSRVHGDLERDYNDFVIEPTFFSQGPGNFRDVAQNRRSDVMLNPRIGASSFKMFLSFIQADGYQPSCVEAVAFTIKDINTCIEIATRAVGHADGVRAQRETLAGILNNGPFRPGQVFQLMEQQHIELIMNAHDFVDMVAAAAETTPMAVAKAQGFWADHWTYFVDMIDTYLSVYPEMEKEIMYETKIPYFFSPISVRPRRKKYVLSLSYEGEGKHVRQLGATFKDQKKESIRLKYFNNKTGWYGVASNWQHDLKGNIFMSSPLEKLFVLAAIKFATRDAYGMGIEYEAGKPGWNDAMNGLPGMIGSGMPETYELVVLIRYVHSALAKFQEPLAIPVEVASLVESINAALDELDHSGYREQTKPTSGVPPVLFHYWDVVSSAREEYRSATATSFSGEVEEIFPEATNYMLERWIDQLELGIARSLMLGTHGKGDNGTSAISPTYFSFNVTRWIRTGEKNEEGHPLVTPSVMEVGSFPLFLEGPVRMMKICNESEALDIYESVKNSGLRDEGLRMYTISANLEGQSYDMGRMMAFTPGWLENQSVWLHMSYKFYLELIRNGLYEHFFDEMTSGGMLPFMKPEIYGRSLLECSSFLASSAFLDPSFRGRGFAARLSGSTAEFMSMWTLMFIGPKPFFIDETTDELRMQLKPALPLWLFNGDTSKRKGGKRGGGEVKEEAKISFKLFSSINVTYHNTRRRDLYGTSPKWYQIGFRDGSVKRVDGPVIPSDLAVKIRRVVFVDCIDAYF